MLSDPPSNARPKFAFVSTMEGVPWGGSEELWAGAAQRLLQRGHRVVLCVKDWGHDESPVIGELAAAGAVVYRRAQPSTPTTAQRVWQGLCRRCGGRKTPPSALEQLTRERPDFALVSSGGSVPPGSLCLPLQRAGIPYAVLVQAASEQWWPDEAIRQDAITVLKAARAALFVSEENRRVTARQLVYEHPNTRVVRNPFRVAFDRVVPWPAATPPWRLAVVGRLDPAAKGTDLVIEVLARPEWRERPLEVTFFGSGSARAGLEALVAARGLKNVHFAGWTSDVPGIWRTHHGLLLPSRFEGLPLALVEAMLSGRPCVVTDVGGNAELIEDGRTGFIAAAPTISLVADALERAWAARAQWAEIGAAAAQAARRQVPADPIGRFTDLLLELATSPSPKHAS